MAPALLGAVVAVTSVPFVRRPVFGLGDSCVVHRATGWLCPVCGLTRGAGALLHLDLVGGLRYNALAVPFLALLLMATVSAVSSRGRAVQAAIAARLSGTAWVGLGLGATAYAVGRNVV